MLRIDAAQRLGMESRVVTSREVLGNIDAMTCAVNPMDEGGNIALEALLETHRRLMTGTRLEELGGSDYNPCSDSFVPAPPEQVLELLDDFMRFCNGDSLPGLAHAVVAHAQLETIRPFMDGNGRTGRALVHMVLHHRGPGLRILAPVSLILATWPNGYIDGLGGTRYVGPSSSSEAHAGTNCWIALFASAFERSVEDTGGRERELQSG